MKIYSRLNPYLKPAIILFSFFLVQKILHFSQTKRLEMTSKFEKSFFNKNKPQIPMHNRADRVLPDNGHKKFCCITIA